jgi:hypothetical protein
MCTRITARLVLATSFGNRTIVIALAAVTLTFVGGLAHAGTIATNPNQLFGRQTPTFKLTDFENEYDANGNIVPGAQVVVGDTIQGVFAVTQVQNGSGAQYDTGSPGTGVELTGVVDEYIAGIDAAGNYILTADTTSVLGSKQ